MTGFTKTIGALCLGALTLTAACSNQVNAPNQNQKAQKGALIGGAIGALAGLASGDNAKERRNRLLLGAALGAAGGGVIGHTLDKQEEELRRALGRNVGIDNDGRSLTLTLPQDILFATNSAALSGGLQSDLITIVSSINAHPNTRINIIGHTDNTGSSDYNQTLSVQRAQAVSSVLVNAGVAAHRLNAVGMGENVPKASNLTEEGKRLNRRVELVIIPNG